jgi:hypothetical protein
MTHTTFAVKLVVAVLGVFLTSVLPGSQSLLAQQDAEPKLLWQFEAGG